MDMFCTYEQHFELSGHPFGSSRDPAVYFDSREHRRAFTCLRHAALAGGCFMTLTGDIGAGKTMLARKVLAGLETERIVAAWPIGTALDARELLVAILSAFSAPTAGQLVDELRADLQAYLTTLEATGRRGLVAVDEAQHLEPDALAVLMELAEPEPAGGPALQVLLVGHRQLRINLSSHLMRQPVFLFCDVGALSQTETRAYIEHRLHQVQWNQSPSFSDAAHECIHRATDGLPRRINKLCHRLLMAASQQQQTSISSELVEQTHADLCDEMGIPVETAVDMPDEAALDSEPPALDTPGPERSAIPILFAADALSPSISLEFGPRGHLVPAPEPANDMVFAATPWTLPEPGPSDSVFPEPSTTGDTASGAAPSSEPAFLQTGPNGNAIGKSRTGGSNVRRFAIGGAGLLVVELVVILILQLYQPEPFSSLVVAPRAGTENVTGEGVNGSAMVRAADSARQTLGAGAQPIGGQRQAPPVASPVTSGSSLAMQADSSIRALPPAAQPDALKSAARPVAKRQMRRLEPRLVAAERDRQRVAKRAAATTRKSARAGYSYAPKLKGSRRSPSAAASEPCPPSVAARDLCATSTLQ
ncbi:MAG: AAA family ATPase [Betaproteobacteria bacterium]